MWVDDDDADETDHPSAVVVIVRVSFDEFLKRYSSSNPLGH
jgi:hypothetical protein